MIETVPFLFQNSKIGTAVFQVQAEDPDDPNTPNGKIVYSFLDDGSDNGVFEIGETFSAFDATVILFLSHTSSRCADTLGYTWLDK